jgi:hypothetical protein
MVLVNSSVLAVDFAVLAVGGRVRLARLARVAVVATVLLLYVVLGHSSS